MPSQSASMLASSASGYGQMGTATKASLAGAVGLMPASDTLGRTQTALQLALVSPEFAIQR